MFKNRTVSGFLLLVFVVLSYFVLIKYVTPLVVETTTSDLYIDETGDSASAFPTDTNMAQSATIFCFDALAAEYEETVDIDTSNLDHTTWPLGGYHYIVKARIPANQLPDNLPRIMVCEIMYDQSTQSPNSAESWTVTGLSYTVPDDATP